MDWQQMIFQFMGGLGLFLFAIKFMGDGLQKSAGDRLRDILDRFTTNPLMGVLVGILVTVLIQSSSGTTVITVGLVSTGFMTLRQAIGVIMGANIGTTVTAFIIGINIGVYAYPILMVGSVLLFFFKKRSLQNIGQILFGFGGLFIGLEMMSNGMKPLRELPQFIDLMLSMSDSPVLGVAVGTIFTLIVQSSSATIGILQELYSEGLISLDGALPVLFGDNIGTTITAILAALSATVVAKRVAATHVLFNVLGTIIFTILLVPFTALITWFAMTLSLEPKMQIAFAHGTFNVVNTLIQLPFIGVWAYLVTKLIPGKEDEKEAYKPKFLDNTLINKSPTIAIGQAKKEINHIGELSLEGLTYCLAYYRTHDEACAEKIAEIEAGINELDRATAKYLVRIMRQSVARSDSYELKNLLEKLRDVERIGDHFETLVHQMDYQRKNGIKISGGAEQELEEMFNLTIATLEMSLKTILDDSNELEVQTIEMYKKLTTMERELREVHFARLNNGECTAEGGIVFTDLINHLEQIGSHAVGIARK